MTVRRWLITDHLGSGVVWLAEDGTRLRHTEYAPFGKIDAEYMNGGVAPPRLYAGHRTEEVTGLVYMQARWMDPATGTFVSVDPLVPDAGDPQAFNAYAYARSNPILMLDPDGRASMDRWGTCYGTCGGVGSSVQGPATGTAYGGDFGGTTVLIDGANALYVAVDTFSDHGYAIRFESGGGQISGLSPEGLAGVSFGQGTQFAGPGAPRSLEEVRALNDIFDFEDTVGPIDPEVVELYEQLLIVIPAEGAAGAAAKAAGAARAGATAATARSAGALWKLGANKSATKWARQMVRRGWTPQQITEAIRNGQQFKAVNKVNPGNAAARFVHPMTGRSVVQDTVTKEIIHVGGTGFRY